jgi:hypothetical protein
MTEQQDWEHEKIERLRQAGQAPDEPVIRNIKDIHTVRASLLAALIAGAVLIYPVFNILLHRLFGPTLSHWLAALIAVGQIYVTGGLLERTEWFRDRRLNIVSAVVLGLLGSLFALSSALFLSGLLGLNEIRKELGKAQAVSEKQLPILGYEHEGNTRKYLKLVAERRSNVGSTAGMGLDQQYAVYRRIYVEPVVHMGYDFDITLSKLSEAFLVRKGHIRLDENIELMMFNSVCFREKLHEDGLIKDATLRGFEWIGSEWTEVAIPPREPEFRYRLSRFDQRCPVEKLDSIYNK